MAGDGDLASRRLRQQVALVSDHDFAFQLQLNEAIQASLRVPTPNQPSSSAATAAASCSCRSCQPVSALWSSEVALAELARQEKNRRDAQAFRAAHAKANTSSRVASRGALLARELAGTPDLFERPLDPSRSPSSRVFYKGLSNKEGAGERFVVRTIQKRVEMFVGGRMELEVLALKEGIQAALEVGIRWVNIVSDFKALHKYMLGTWRPTKNKSEHLVNEALSLMRKFNHCEFSLIPRGQVGYATKLATDLVGTKKREACKRETCTICLEDTDVSKIHAVEGCAHRFCLSCMKEHVRVKLGDGTLPACPQDGCTTKLTVEGSKIFLSPQLLETMAQRIREAQIPPTQKVYCPNSRCSALMSSSEAITPTARTCCWSRDVGEVREMRALVLRQM
ncbi:hypothetical protein VPH35_127977 [Triticum aestivum]